jgi:hypothetical protein
VSVPQVLRTREGAERRKNNMTLDDYKELAVEARPKKGDYENEDMRTFQLICDWTGYYLDELKKLQDLSRKMKTLVHERSNFYLGKTEVPYEFVVLKSDLSRYLEADPQIQKLQAAIDDQTNMVTFTKNTHDGVTKRSFDIKGAREWAIWSQGGRI